MVLTGSAALLAGGVAAGIVRAAAPGSPANAPPLPWKWAALDPDEAGRRGYRFYKERGGCGTASYLSLLSLLQEKVGYPWTTLPDMMMAHAAAGYGGHGTLCGALGGASTIINMVTYGEVRDAYQQNNKIIDRLFAWYTEQDFPTTRFDGESPLKGQVRVKAGSPLCHVSVSKWVVAVIWRRERDSNPRRAFDPYTLSRGAPSTTRPSLRLAEREGFEPSKGF
jgi:hypothetical protein